MAIDWDTQKPAWLSALSLLLPDDVEAIFVSENDNGFETTTGAHVLAVAPSGLFGCQIRAKRYPEGWQAHTSVDQVPLSTVAVLAMKQYASQGGDDEAISSHGFKATLHLSKELPDFGESIDLPRALSDYEGDRNRAQEVAREFVHALMGLLTASS